MRQPADVAHTQALHSPVFTSADIHELAGLSYRQINEWGCRGFLPCSRQGKAGWRRFSAFQTMALRIVSELHSRFGVPLVKQASLLAWMTERAATPTFAWALLIMRGGLPIYLVTDFQESEFMDEGLLGVVVGRGELADTSIIMRIDTHVNAVLEAMG